MFRRTSNAKYGSQYRSSSHVHNMQCRIQSRRHHEELPESTLGLPNELQHLREQLGGYRIVPVWNRSPPAAQHLRGLLKSYNGQHCDESLLLEDRSREISAAEGDLCGSREPCSIFGSGSRVQDCRTNKNVDRNLLLEA